jgi:hypothetical protein
MAVGTKQIAVKFSLKSGLAQCDEQRVWALVAPV